MVEANYGWVNSYLKPQLGNVTGYTIVQAAAHEKDGEELAFYKGCNDYLSSLNKDWLTDPKYRFGTHNCFEETKVKTRSIDSLIQQYGVPAFIKIDVESHEE